MNESYGKNKLLYLVLFFSSLKLAIHLYTNGFASYGIFRDEFYYIACSKNLAAGYVDHPPFSIFLLALSRTLFGEGLFALRLLPALAAAGTVFITGMLVIRMKGGAAAVSIASISVIAAPIMLGMNTIYSMNSFDHLFWTLSAYLILLIITGDKRKNWIILGIVFGLALLNKIGIMWLIAGFYAGLLLTDKRKKFLSADPYITGIIAFILFLPFIIWNIANDFAHIEFIQNATKYKYDGLSRLDFIAGQVLLPNPVNLIVWLPGLYFLFFHRDGKEYKILAILYAVSFLILLINGNTKPEYLSAAYPLLFAAGGKFIEIISFRKKTKWLKFAVPGLVAVSGILLAPLALPILPVETYIKYQDMIGIGPASNEGKQLNELPQFYADMFGWEEMAKTVSSVYLSLSEEERQNIVIFAQNYGEAASLQYFSSKYPLPRVISTHNNYWIWGYPQKIENVIVLGGEEETHKGACGSLGEKAVIRSRYAIPYENNMPVYYCRGLKINPAEIWKHEKIFI